MIEYVNSNFTPEEVAMLPRWAEESTEFSRPPGVVKRLLYNRTTDTLVAVMAESEPPARRLYYRRLPESAYHAVGLWHDLESQQDAHCCDLAPFLIFNEMRFRAPEPIPPYLQAVIPKQTLPPPLWGANWVGIRRFNLATGEDMRILDEAGLRIPPPFTSGWVSQILSVAGDGSGAIAVVGLTPGSEMTYFVVELSFNEGLVRTIAELPDVFL